MPAIVAALYQTAAKLNYLDKRLFKLPLVLAWLNLKSHEQTAWINVVTQTVWQECKAEAADKVQKTLWDIRQFFIILAVQPALPQPHAVQIDGWPIPRLRDE